MSASVQRKLQQAQQSLANGSVSAAVALCEDVLQRAPRNPEALWLLGTAHLMQERPDLAVPLLERAVEVVPERGSALESLGLAYLMLGDYAPAERVLRKAAARPGAPGSVRMRLGLALLHKGEHVAAIEELEGLLNDTPQDPDARLTLGRAYAAAARWSDAAREFDSVLAVAPHHLHALFNLGVAAAELGDNARARATFERILELEPGSADTRHMLASLQMRLGRFAEALEHWRELVRTRPDDATAHAALAEACFQTGALGEAHHAASQAVALDSATVGGYSVLARIHYIRGELDLAVAALQRGESVTDSGALLGLRMHLLHRMCDWPRWEKAWQRLAARLEKEADLGSPFSLLCEDTTAAQQLSYTQRWAQLRFANIARATRQVKAMPSASNRRLRIGYFSSDFQEHAVAHLLVEALECHDRERFEIFAYSYGPEDGSEMRRRLRGGIEHFIDISREADDEAVSRIRADALDLLVDLRGYTAGDRLEIMAQRPAPVQATWLGYPGTTGVDFIDYLIADEYLISEKDEAFYSERVLRLPVCYQPNDSKRSVAQPLTRAEYGLPEDAFVFCCFNQVVKIMPSIFSRWMSLLRRVPRSVLWLLDENRWATANLKSAAAAEGIDPQRIIFGARLANPEHLARFRVAHVSLDSHPYTSHTTASDSLWLGCPLVSLSGKTFAGRVSASIVSACGLPELVTRTLDDYEALAFSLATDADHLSGIKSRLDAARDSAALFDSRKFARDLETLFLTMTR